MEIFKYGAEVLRQEAEPIKNINQEIIDLLDEMIETMVLAPGIGLAATQVGRSLAMFVMHVDENRYEKIINPRVLKTSGVNSYNEGCLSFPKLFVDVVRPQWIQVSYLNERGEEVIREREGLWARCFQHELEHLEGKLFVDHFSKKQLRTYKEQLDQINHLGLKQNSR